jgi:hypothetical protein
MSSFISLDLNHKSAGVEDESETLRRILPVLRRQPGYPTRVLALFEDEIVVSSCWLRRSLEVGDFAGRVPPPPWRSWRVSPEDIRGVTAVEPNRGGIYADYAWRFRVRTRAGRHLFVFPERDGELVYRYFRQRVPDSLKTRTGYWAHFTWILAALLPQLALTTLVYCLVLAGLTAFTAFIGKEYYGSGVVLTSILYGLALLIFFVRAVTPYPAHASGLGSRSRWHRLFEGALPRISNPLWLQPIGWSLKLAAVGWYCYIWLAEQSSLKPMTDQRRGIAGTWLLLILYSPALFLIYWGYRVCRATPKRGRAATGGFEILYLRAFDEDQMVTLQPRTWLANALGVFASDMPGLHVTDAARFRSRLYLLLNLHPVRIVRMFFDRGADTAEEVLTSFFSAYGTVTAIGRPDERIPPPGAARVYAVDDDWQREVAERLGRAQVVIIQPGTSSGVRWETLKALETVEPQRILFNLAGLWRHTKDFEDFLAILPNRIRAKVPREVPHLERPAFMYFEKDWAVHLQLTSYRSPLLWPLLGDATDLKYTLAPFVEGVKGGAGLTAPRPPGKHPVQTALAWAFVVVVIAAAVGAPTADTGSAVRYPVISNPVGERPSAERPSRPFPRDTVRPTAPVEYRGKKVPYTLRLRGPWLQRDVPLGNPYLDYVFSHEVKFASIQILSARRKDLASLKSYPQVRLKVLRRDRTMKGVRQISLIDSYPLVRGGEKWMAVHIKIQLENGVTYGDYSRAYMSSKGTIYLIGLIADDDAFALSLLEEAFDSIRVGE